MDVARDKPLPRTAQAIRGALTRIPPPPVFVLPLVLGLVAGQKAPQPIVPVPAEGLARALGVVLIALGLGMVAGCVALFVRRRTTIVPHRRAAALVTDGPYRLTRNPMYVSLTLIYLGVVAFTNVLWPLLLLPIPLLLVAAVHIPFEERTMHDVFGDDYRCYAARVRRWL